MIFEVLDYSIRSILTFATVQDYYKLDNLIFRILDSQIGKKIRWNPFLKPLFDNNPEFILRK